MTTPRTADAQAAIVLLQRAMDRQPDADQPSPAYCWLTDAANHLRGYHVRHPEYRASVLYPEAR